MKTKKAIKLYIKGMIKLLKAEIKKKEIDKKSYFFLCLVENNIVFNEKYFDDELVQLMYNIGNGEVPQSVIDINENTKYGVKQYIKSHIPTEERFPKIYNHYTFKNDAELEDSWWSQNQEEDKNIRYKQKIKFLKALAKTL